MGSRRKGGRGCCWPGSSRPMNLLGCARCGVVEGLCGGCLRHCRSCARLQPCSLTLPGPAPPLLLLSLPLRSCAGALVVKERCCCCCCCCCCHRPPPLARLLLPNLLLLLLVLHGPASSCCCGPRCMGGSRVALWMLAWGAAAVVGAVVRGPQQGQQLVVVGLGVSSTCSWDAALQRIRAQIKKRHLHGQAQHITQRAHARTGPGSSSSSSRRERGWAVRPWPSCGTGSRAR